MITGLRTFYYKLKYQYILRRATFGRGTVVRCKLHIKGPGRVNIGADCVLDSDPWGTDYITLFTHRKRARIIIGNRVVLRACRFGSHLKIIIRDDAVIENSSLYDSDFHNIDPTRRDHDFNAGDKNVVIGEGSYVGCECLCSKGTVLGEGVTLLPASVIGTKSLSRGNMASGNPARILKA